MSRERVCTTLGVALSGQALIDYEPVRVSEQEVTELVSHGEALTTEGHRAVNKRDGGLIDACIEPRDLFAERLKCNGETR
jgi:hypothetical protein